MLQLQAATTKNQAHTGLRLAFARHQDEVEAAQRLRFKVFAEEMGARLPQAHTGLDRDLFDPHCEHLLVWDDATDEVVGTYRLLTPVAAKRLGAFYSDGEFDLVRLQHLRPRLVEVGRSCVHPEYRQGPTMMHLWRGLAQYMRRENLDYLMGCASICMKDGGHAAASIYRRTAGAHLAPPEWRVFPRCALPLEQLDQSLSLEPPPLLKGYLRLGAYIGGEPAWDPDFNTADVLVLLPMARMNPRYVRHFFGA